MHALILAHVLITLIVRDSTPRLAPAVLVLQHAGMDSVRLVDVRYVTPRLYSARLLAFNLALVRELQDAGVGLLAGSDAPTLNVPGFALHDELQLLGRSGLSPAAALRAATSNVGRFLHADSIGVVRGGAYCVASGRRSAE